MSDASRRLTVTNLAAPMLTARSVKVVVPLDPHELARLTAAEGQARTVLRIAIPGSPPISADIATKSLRKAVATVREAGPDNAICFIQGKLVGTQRVIEAGLVAQAKMPKPEPAA